MMLVTASEIMYLVDSAYKTHTRILETQEKPKPWERHEEQVDTKTVLAGRKRTRRGSFGQPLIVKNVTDELM